MDCTECILSIFNKTLPFVIESKLGLIAYFLVNVILMLSDSKISSVGLSMWKSFCERMHAHKRSFVAPEKTVSFIILDANSSSNECS